MILKVQIPEPLHHRLNSRRQGSCIQPIQCVIDISDTESRDNKRYMNYTLLLNFFSFTVSVTFNSCLSKNTAYQILGLGKHKNLVNLNMKVCLQKRKKKFWPD